MTLKAIATSSSYEYKACPESEYWRAMDEYYGTDAVTSEEMKNPKIAPCGHTLSEDTWKKIFTKAAAERRPALCPLDRKVVDPTRLALNLFAKESIDRENQLKPLETQREKNFWSVKADNKTLVESINLMVEQMNAEREGLRGKIEEKDQQLQAEREEFRGKTEEKDRQLQAERKEFLNQMQAERTEFLAKIDERNLKIERLISENTQKTAALELSEQKKREYVVKNKKLDRDYHQVKIANQQLETENQQIKLKYQEVKDRTRELAQLNSTTTQTVQDLETQVQELKKALATEAQRVSNLLNAHPCDLFWSSCGAVSLTEISKRDLSYSQLQQLENQLKKFYLTF